jgi:PAS domain S-box-containing protein
MSGRLNKGTIETGSKRAEHALETSETRYRRLFEASRDGILILDADTGKIVDVNPFLMELTGYSHEEFLGKHLWEIGPFKDVAASKVSFAELQTREYVRYEGLPLEARDGRTIDVEFVSNVYRVGDLNVIQCNIRDITARKITEKQAEDELRFSNLILSTQKESAIDGILVVDVNGKTISFNRRFTDIWGIPPNIIKSKSDEHALQSVMDMLANPEKFISKVKHLYAAPDEITQDEIVLKDNRTFDCYSAPMIGADGKHFGRVWYFRDITIRKQALAALSQSEERFRILFEHAADIILQLEITPSGIPVIRGANSATFRILGYKRDELIGQPVSFINEAVTDSSKQFKERRQIVLSSTGKVFEARHRCKDGTIREFECSVTEMKIGSKTFGISVERDITERKLSEAKREELEAQLLQSQKLEAIGQLSGGVAHDFNNLLGVIMGYAELMKMNLDTAVDLERYVQQIISTCAKGAALTKQLLSFARKAPIEFINVDLNHIIKNVVEIIKRTMDRRIEIVLDLQEQPAVVSGDWSQLENVFLNIAINARDAMPEGGRLSITVKTVESSQVVLPDGDSKTIEGPYVRISIADTGTGMSREIKEHIFEPFFTTKGVGKGTGLGLASVYGCIKQHFGHITLESQEGKGTEFTIYLPTIPSTGAIERLKEAATLLPGTGTLLVVDDETTYHEILTEIFQGLGYTVHCCADGAEAVAFYREHTSTTDIVILDINMPKMNGPQCLLHLKEINPRVKVIVTSGYGDSSELEAMRKEGVSAFVHKPYRAAELAKKIAEVAAT